MNNKVNRLISVFMILILICTAVVTTAIAQSEDNSAILNNKIPLPIPPAGFTDKQVKQAIDIGIKETQNQTNKTNKGLVPKSQSQFGDGLWIIGPKIDTRYVVYKYQQCRYCNWIYPNLFIPLKTEVWDNKFNPASNAYIYWSLYYWNYFPGAHGWTQLWSSNKYTNIDGISRQGFSIRYNTYSDIYYLYGYVYYNGKFQQTGTFFNVEWY